jgi:hypothetical protein
MNTPCREETLFQAAAQLPGPERGNLEFLPAQEIRLLKAAR